MLTHPTPIATKKSRLDEGVIDVPYFEEGQLPERHCSRYARLSAQYIFGQKFPVAHAWTMRNQGEVFTQKASNATFPRMVAQGLVKPGMLVGVYFDRSLFNDDKKCYTHMSVYVGQKNNQPAFLEQIIDVIRVAGPEDYKIRGFEIREVLGLRN